MTTPADSYKVKQLATGSPAAAYRALVYGDMPLRRIIWMEILIFFIGSFPGAAGLWLRMKLYPRFFRACGKKVLFGRNLILRHPHKITLGDGVILDDNATLDAKGTTNHGITLGARVYVGRGTTIYCKNGDIAIGDNISISANCILFSSNALTLKPNTVIASFTYILSGGEYDIHDPTPFAFQNGTCTKGPLEIGENCWIGAGAKILDAASLGDHVVIGAGAVVNRPIPAHSVAFGIPAKPRKTLPPDGTANN